MGVGAMQSKSAQTEIALTILGGLIVSIPMVWAVYQFDLKPDSRVLHARQIRELEAENNELRRRVELCEKTHYQAPTVVGGGR